MAFEDKYLFNKNLSKQESKFDSSRLAITSLFTNFSIRTPQLITVLKCVWYLSSRQVYMKLSFFLVILRDIRLWRQCGRVVGAMYF